MPFDGITIHALNDEIRTIIIGSRIDKIHQPENDEIVLHLRSDKKNYKLLLSADSNLPYYSLTELKKENPDQAPMFCMLMRKHLSGGRIKALEQLELERVVIFTIESRDELGDITEKKLIFEIMGKHSNISLIDQDNKIIDCIKRIPLGVNRYRQLFPGITYLYPPNDKLDPRNETPMGFIEKIATEQPLYKHIYTTYQGLSPIVAKEICIQAHVDFNSQTLDDFEKIRISQVFIEFFSTLNKHIHPQIIYAENKALKDLSALKLSVYQQPPYHVENTSSLIAMVNGYFANKNTVNKLLQRSFNLRKSIQGKIDRLKKKLINLSDDLRQAEQAEELKIYGDLILANIYRLEKGMHKAVLENFYNDNQPITVPLDMLLSPSDNAQKYFKKYSKLKTAQVKVNEQIQHTKDEIFYLEHVLLNAEQSDDHQNIEDIKDELIESGYIKKKQKHQKKKVSKSEPYCYKTSDGFDLLVGKNNLQNDHLSLKIANKSDYWFHTKDIAGSHVILRCLGQEPSETAIKEAAMIAAYHSKGQSSSQVPVDYTQVKHLKKPNGAKPGMVIFSTNQTIYVTPVESEIYKLKCNYKSL
ncbi:MAG: NFACT family protein [Clostridia bacterium]|nr:NFACT family protein [Clostridia bacterium]